MFQLIDILLTCQDILQGSSGCRVVHILRHRYSVLFGQLLHHLYTIARLELIYSYRLAGLLCYLGQLSLYQLRGIGIAHI